MIALPGPASPAAAADAAAVLLFKTGVFTSVGLAALPGTLASVVLGVGLATVVVAVVAVTAVAAVEVAAIVVVTMVVCVRVVVPQTVLLFDVALTTVCSSSLHFVHSPHDLCECDASS